MAKLCCVLNKETRTSVTCRECEKHWECWCAWHNDRTHRDEDDFKVCPKTKRHIGWDHEVPIDGHPSYIAATLR